MNGTRFDDLVRALLGGTSRRAVLRLSALPLAGGLAAFLLDDDESEAKKRKHKKNKKKRKKRKKKAKSCNGGDVCANGCPFSTVQAAIEAAAAGDTITLCAGSFTGNLTINKDLTLVGAGEDVTTLQGDGAGTVVTINGGIVKLQDLRITGGAGADYGGGIYNAGTLTLTGCTVSGNNTDNGYGNGIYNEVDSTLTVADCTISENGLDAPGAPFGGGIYSEGTLSVSNSRLTGNRANQGGGLHVFRCTAEITGCDISGNVIVDDDDDDYTAVGGAIAAVYALLTVDNCTMLDNSGAANGGAVHMLYSIVTFTNCEINGNSASAEGGGIYNDGRIDEGGDPDSTLTLSDTEVTENTAGGPGGGIYNVGELATVSCTGGTITGNAPDQCVNADGGSGCNTCA
jgi:ferredoxin